MKQVELTHKNLNNGKQTLIHHPLGDKEFENQFYEIFEVEHYKEGKIRDGVYVDLGANIGLTALYFKDFAKKYYAIEPSSQNFEALEKNTDSLNNVELFNFAIMSNDGEDYMWQTAKDSVPQTFFGSNNEAFGKERVKCKRLDTFFKENNIEHIDVLKIDVESSEYVILPSESFKNVADKIDLIIGEAHYNNQGLIPDIIPAILKEYDFKTEFVNLPQPNMIYKFYYIPENKEYEYRTNTIFIARRENA